MKVYTTIDAWNKMSYWAALGGKEHREFTCFGQAHHDDGDLYVTDCFLVKQEGTSAGVDGDDADINRLMMELYEKGIEPDEAFRCWIHSHPGTGKGATYLSGTDDANIERYLTGQWLISIVLDSKGGNPFCQVDVKEPRQSIKCEFETIMPTMDDAIKKAAKEEFDEKSSGRTYTPWKPGQGQTGHTDEHGVRRTYGQFGGRGGGQGSYSGRYPHYGAGSGSTSGSSGSGGAGESGKGSGAGQNSNGSGSGAGRSGSSGTGGQTELDGMLLLGSGFDMFDGDEDEYDAWLKYYLAEDAAEMAGVPDRIVRSDTEEVTEIDIPDGDIPGVKSLDAESVPEWVVALADTFGTTVEDIRGAVNVEEADGVIDKLVEQVQCGYKAVDVAVEDLEKMGLSKEIAEKEINTRVNA
jgi:hypothetical protein